MLHGLVIARIEGLN